jgi:four helix bundle protein
MAQDSNQRIFDIKERTFEFARRSVRLYLHLQEQGKAGKVLSPQMLRAGTSIGANLEEADAGQSKADFIHKCSISLKEARETLFWLRLFEAEKIVETDRIAPMIQECNELVSILTVIIKNSQSRN